MTRSRCCEVNEPGQALPGQRRAAAARGRPGARGRRRQFRPRGRRDARPGRRIGLRQEHHRALHPAPDRADLGRSPVRGQQCHGAGRERAARAGARHADHLPGPVRIAEPAHDGGRDHRRGADHPQAHEDRARIRGPHRRAARNGGPERRPHAALSARILRRPAPAHRHRARAGGESRS